MINILERVKSSLTSGKYCYTGHASLRLQERTVARYEVKQVLASGHHEKRKDSFDETFQQWSYAIRGRTIDQRLLRIIVSFDPCNMLVITVIDLKQ